jgi:hypothetical protein
MADYASGPVLRGLKLLDKKMPGWADKIDLATLEMESCDWCVIGQLFGQTEWAGLAYNDGLAVLGIADKGEEFGFDLMDYFDGQARENWNTYWRDAVISRQTKVNA